jgi:hypothetical protein
MRASGIIYAWFQRVFEDKVQIVYRDWVPYRRDASKLLLGNFREVREASSGFFCHVAIVPNARRKKRLEQGCNSGSEAYVIYCVHSCSDLDILDVLVVVQETEVAVSSALINLCLEESQ